jgi:thioredoxin 1
MASNNIGFKSNYEEETLTYDQVSALQGTTLLEFGAPWCVHCQAATPAIKKIFTEHNTLIHIKIFDGKGKRLGRAFKVKLWPTLILLKNGHEIARIVRPINAAEVEQFVSKINERQDHKITSSKTSYSG